MNIILFDWRDKFVNGKMFLCKDCSFINMLVWNDFLFGEGIISEIFGK